MEPFAGVANNTVSLSAAGSTGNVALTLGAPAERDIEVFNDGDETAFVAFGSSAVTTSLPNGATPGGRPIPAGALVVLALPKGATHAAGITAGTSVPLYFTPGRGL